MDLSRLKWPIIIIVVVGLGWLLTSPGINFMHKKFTAAQPGADPKVDQANEAGLTNLAGFLIKTFRYKKAGAVLDDALRLYPEGANAWYNLYRKAKCEEKAGRYQEAVNILKDLMDQNANAQDSRVPSADVLKLRRDKLLETHNLGEIE